MAARRNPAARASTQSVLAGRAVWPSITKAARSKPGRAFVAVPYFGKLGARLLPISFGSRLVVNASADAVKAGQTSPAALLTLHRRGVSIFSCPRLHAKVYVFGSVAIVGSANASGHSADGLVEAVVRSSDRPTVTAAREFVREMSRPLVPLGEEQLQALEKIYREPKLMIWRGATQRPSKGTRSPRVWIVHVREDELPVGAGAAVERESSAAKRVRTNRRHEVDCFWFPRDVAYRRGDTVVEVVHAADGRTWVCRPSTVIRLFKWRRGTRRWSFTFYERPPGRRIALDRLAKALGRGAKRRLARAGAIRDCALRDELLGHFAA